VNQIDPEVAVTIGITPGDAIEISGTKRTSAISREAQPRVVARGLSGSINISGITPV